MNKFNRKFNSACSRVAFWDALTKHFNGFVTLLKPIETLSPEDRVMLKSIHGMLYECYKTAKGRRNRNIKDLQKLRKEHESCK